MRADRLVSLVRLLRQRGRLSAAELARELEVSRRTVLRDVEALSSAGVPVYAERGRHGGFALLPGFRADLSGLTGLTPDEALALLTAGTGGGDQVFGLGAALSSAMHKMVDALPAQRRSATSDASRRLLVEPEVDLLSRPRETDEVPDAVMREVRRAVVEGRRLRLRHATDGAAPRWRTVDPLGLVTVRGRRYLLATRSGEDRTYRLSRVVEVEVSTEPAERPEEVDLERLWRERGERFRAGGDTVVVEVRLRPSRREELLATAVAVLADRPDPDDPGTPSDPDGWWLMDVVLQDQRHAVWALWGLGADAEVLAPETLRAVVRERALAVAERYAD